MEFISRDIRGLFKDTLTYDDVQIVPQYSNVESRSKIETKTRLVSDIWIDHPIIPANMDTISGLDMHKTISDSGGAMFFHRFNDNIHDQVETLKSAIRYVNTKIIGISLGAKNDDLWVAEQCYETFLKYGRVGQEIIFLIDVAHGHHNMVGRFISSLRVKYNHIPIIAGNVATVGGAEFLWSSGAHGIKIGIGPGSLCTTRLETGCGVPQFSAIADIYSWAMERKEEDRPTLIADGGIKHNGDILKAIGAGANSVMTGYLFAGTSDTPGELVWDGVGSGFPYKRYRGSASRDSKLDRGEKSNIEGVSMMVPFKGITKDVITIALDGLKSGLSYAGFNNLEEAVGNVLFNRVSSSSIMEAGPHATYKR